LDILGEYKVRLGDVGFMSFFSNYEIIETIQSVINPRLHISMAYHDIIPSNLCVYRT